MELKYNLKQLRPLIILMTGILIGYILASFTLVPKIEEQRQEFFKEEFEDYIKIREQRLKGLNIN